MNRKRTELLYFSAPVHQHPRRTNDEKSPVGRTCRYMNHCRDRLNRLSEPHFIAQKNTTLMQYVLCSEFLISAKISPKRSKFKSYIIDLRRQLLRNTAVNQRLRNLSSVQFFKDGIELGSVVGKIHPGIDNSDLRSPPVHLCKFFYLRIPVGEKETFHFIICPNSALFGFSSGEDPVKTVLYDECIPDICHKGMQILTNRSCR